VDFGRKNALLLFRSTLTRQWTFGNDLVVAALGSLRRLRSGRRRIVGVPRRDRGTAGRPTGRGCLDPFRRRDGPGFGRRFALSSGHDENSV